MDRPDDLWERIEPLLPKKKRRFRYPGRPPVPDRQVLCGTLYVLHTDIQWEHLPKEPGFGSGMTCWRRAAPETSPSPDETPGTARGLASTGGW